MKDERMPSELRPEEHSSTEEENLITENSADVCVVGVGSFGCEIGSRLKGKDIFGVEIIAIDDHPDELLRLKADKKFFLNNGIPRGLATCGNPIVGEMAAKRDAEQLGELIKGKRIIILIAGLGGQIGTGASPIIAEIAKNQGSLVIGAFSLPMGPEGRIRTDNAIESLAKLRKISNTIILIPLDRMKEVFPELEFRKVWDVSPEAFTEAIREVIITITESGAPNTDSKKFRSILFDGGIVMIGMGESEISGPRGWEEASSEAISSPLLVADMSKATSSYVSVGHKLVKVNAPQSVMSAKEVIVSFSSGYQKPDNDIEKIMANIRDRIVKDAGVYWFSSVDKSLSEAKRCTILLTGIAFPHCFEEVPAQNKRFDHSNEVV